MSPRLLRSPARLASASLLRVQSDERLVELARAGHNAAFEAIFERYRPALERYAARLVGPSRGEDAVQQAFVNAHKALSGESDRKIELKPWLYRIVHNAALNSLRSTRDEQLLGDDAERLGLSEDVFERRERLREALEAVAALPEKQRDAILLRELEGRSHEEIAVALGMSSGAARQQIFRARAALRTAATVITPWPLIVRLMDLGAGSASGGPDMAMGAGAGATALLAKASAGILVTGAVVGGAVGTGAVHAPGHHSHHHRQAVASVSFAQNARRVTALVEGGRLTAMRETSGADGSAHRSSSESSHDSSGHHRHRGSSGRHGASGGSGGSGSSTSSSSQSVLIAGSGSHHSTSVSETETHRSGESQSGRHGSHSGHGGSSHGGHGGSSGHGSHGSHGGHSESGGHHAGGEGETSHEAEPAEVEVGDVSNKPAQAGGGKSGGETTTPSPAAAPTPTTTTAAPPQGGGGGGGGGSASGGGGSASGTVTQQALPGGKG
jgi:RNA polymerase sigma factor (sigma-70 family)